MSYATITGITIAIAVVVVIGIGLLSYMSSLIKSAYQIKVEMRSDLENGLKKIEEELRQKSKWMRSEVGEDVSKMRESIERENDRRLAQLQERLQAIVKEAEDASRAERADLRTALAQVRQSVASLDKDLAALKDEAARRAAIGRPPQARKEAEREAEAMAAAPSATPSPTAVPAAPAPAGPPAESAGAGSSGEASPASAGGAGNRPSGPVSASGSQRIALQDFGDKSG